MKCLEAYRPQPRLPKHQETEESPMWQRKDEKKKGLKGFRMRVSEAGDLEFTSTCFASSMLDRKSL